LGISYSKNTLKKDAKEKINGGFYAYSTVKEQPEGINKATVSRT
jgi:hypothetical protein